MDTDSVLSSFTKEPIFSLTVLFVSVTVTEEILGTTDAGTFSVNVQVREPVSVPPL